MAQRRVFIPLKIHTTIKTSNAPIIFIRIKECSSPKIRPTICWWRGTKLKSLQNKPFSNQTKAMAEFKMSFNKG